ELADECAESAQRSDMNKFDGVLLSQGVCHVRVDTRPRVHVRGIINCKISNLHETAASPFICTRHQGSVYPLKAHRGRLSVATTGSFHFRKKVDEKLFVSEARSLWSK